MFDLDIPESLVGAGDKGGAESLMSEDSEESISFGASLSDFLFREPMAGFT